MRAILLPLACVFYLVGCGDSGTADTHEGVATEVVGSLEEMVEVLDGVTDDASKEAAKGKMEDIARRLEALVKRMEALGEPDPATVKRVEELMQAATRDVGAKIAGLAMKAFSDPKLRELFKVFTDAMQQMSDLGK